MDRDEFHRICREFFREVERMSPNDRPAALAAFRDKWREELERDAKVLDEEVARLEKEVSDEVDPLLAQLEKELEETRRQLEAEVAKEPGKPSSS